MGHLSHFRGLVGQTLRLMFKGNSKTGNCGDAYAKFPELLDFFAAGNCCNHPHLDLMLLVFAGILEVGEEGDRKSF